MSDIYIIKMEKPTIICFLYWILFSVVTARSSDESTPAMFHAGVILDFDTLIGKFGRTSIELAIEDFYTNHANFSTRLVVHYRDGNKDDVQATLAALNLLQNMKIEAIIGPQKSSQAVIVSQIGNRNQVPVISFSATSPTLSSIHVPYFIRTTISDAAQVKAITSLVEAYGWREVVPIYEDTDFGWGIIPYLVDGLQEIDVRIPYRSLISISSTDDQIQQELYKLQTMQTRVFIVHMSSSRGSTLFLNAQKLGMMSEGYIWIMTNGVTNMVDSFDLSVIRAMRGAVGVRLYVPKAEELDGFTSRWKKRFQVEYPKEIFSDPSIYALWAYDTIHVLAMAVEKVWVQSTKIEKNSTISKPVHILSNGPLLLEAISNITFQGLSANFKLIDGQLQYSAFEIINVAGQGMREVGYWRERQGFSKQVDDDKPYSTLSKDLNPVIWPGESIIVPKGWEIPVRGRKLCVGVTMTSSPEFMQVELDPVTNATIARGYAVDVFEEAIKRLHYAVPFEFQLFGNMSEISSLTFNDFVYQVYLGNYDMIIGDITIRYNRTHYADFSVPYTESGVAMIVPVKEAVNKNTFIFLKPLTADLWVACFVFFIYTGIVILILEQKIRDSNEGLSEHLGTIVHLSFFAYQERLEKSLTKMVVIVWVFVLLVLTSSYTASLSSMLTVQQLRPTITDIHDIIKHGEHVGYERGSFVEGLLQELGFDRSKMRGYYPKEFAEALDRGSANGGVAAIVHEVPYIKLFLAKNCKSYTMVGPIYKNAGFGFAFQKNSPLAGDISRAILNITDGEDIIRIEKRWIGNENCRNIGSITVESNRLNFLSFWGLFLFTGVVSTISLLIFAITSLRKRREQMANVMNLEIGSDEANDIESVSTMNQEEYQAEGDTASQSSADGDTQPTP